MNKAIFLDRDGVIIDENNYNKIDKLKLISQSAEAIKILNNNNFLVIIVTNQSGVAKGYFTENNVITFNNKIKEKLKEHNCHIDAIYYCPHHPDTQCKCRKPKSGMLKLAKSKFDIDFKQSFMIGDKISDIEAGNNVSCKSILVLTGYGKDAILNDIKNGNTKTKKIYYIAQNLYDAVEFIIKENNK